MQPGLENVTRTARGPDSSEAHLLALGARISRGPGEALRPRVALEDKDQQLGQGGRTFVPSPPTPPKTRGQDRQPGPGRSRRRSVHITAFFYQQFDLYFLSKS